MADLGVKGLLETVQKLGGLELRTADVARALERADEKVDRLNERVAVLENELRNVRANLKNEIMSDLGVGLARVNMLNEHLRAEVERLRKSPGAPASPSLT